MKKRPFSELHSASDFSLWTQQAWNLMQQLYPICRSITGEGVRETLTILAQKFPIQIHEIPSGTPVFDWTIPKEWHVREAWIKDPAGKIVVDFRKHTLHLMSYSTPVHEYLSLEELRKHLHSLPDHPDWIPYRTSYYKESWGFCLSHQILEGLQAGSYEVLVDSELVDGSLVYGECLIPGDSEQEFLLFTHICHPSLCNDNLTGISVATALAAELSASNPKLTYRLVFAPGTIGSIAWLAKNEHLLKNIQYGLVIGLLGDRGPLTYKRSRQQDASIDRIAARTLPKLAPATRFIDFSPYGYDERQLCSPGINLPVGRLTRTPNSEYQEYHTSADDFDFIDQESISESLHACAELIKAAEQEIYYRNLNPMCEPMLGKHGLYRPTGGTGPSKIEHAMLWILNQSDGHHSLQDISDRSGLTFESILEAANALQQAGLLKQIRH